MPRSPCVWPPGFPVSQADMSHGREPSGGSMPTEGGGIALTGSRMKPLSFAGDSRTAHSRSLTASTDGGR